MYTRAPVKTPVRIPVKAPATYVVVVRFLFGSALETLRV